MDYSGSAYHLLYTSLEGKKYLVYFRPHLLHNSKLKNPLKSRSTFW